MTDEFARLRDSMDPIPAPSREVLVNLYSQLDEWIAAENAVPIARHAPNRRRGRRHARTAIVSIAVTATVLAVVWLLPSSSRIGPRSAAAATLAHLADVAASQPSAIPPGMGQYQYTETESSYQTCVEDAPSYCYNHPEDRQSWIGSDLSGRLRETPIGAPTFLTDGDRVAWVQAGSPAILSATSDVTFGPGTLAFPPVAKLANHPTLKELLTGKIEGGPAGAAEAFTQIGDLLRESDASPSARSALFDLAEEIPGVKYLGTVTDHLGGSGVGLAFDSGAIEHEYVFDPSSSALMSEQSSVIGEYSEGGDAVPMHTVLTWAVYVSGGTVDSLSKTPTGTAPPAPAVTCTAVPGRPGESRCTNRV